MKRLLLAGLLLCVVVLVTRVFAYPTLNNFLTVYAVTTNQALTELHSGRIITNAGAGGAIILDLPEALKGLHFVVSVSTAQTIEVNPHSMDQILGLTNGTGDAIQSTTTIGTTVELVALDTANWLPIRTDGTWSYAD